MIFAVIPFGAPLTVFGHSVVLQVSDLNVGLLLFMALSFRLSDIVDAQSGCWFIVYQPLALIIFLISIAAECKRIPFDLPEAEGELVAGFHTEYSGMRFGLFFVGEYINIIVLGGLAATFFLGGWHGPWLPPVIWFSSKVLVFAFLFIWMRGTLPACGMIN